MTARARTLDDLRLGAALVHALPRCSLELLGADGTTMRIGFDPRCACTPCDLRLALCAFVPGIPELDRLVERGGVAVQLHDDPPDTCHVGLGVYRYRDEGFGFVFATVLEPAHVAEAVCGGDGEEDPRFADPLHVQADPELGVTLLCTRHAAWAEPFAAAVERRFVRAAGACLAAELCGTREHS
jgi:hypothetical protein